MGRIFLLILFSVVVVGAQANPQQEAAEIYAQYFEDNLKLNPLQATRIGDHRYDDQLPNFYSPSYRAEALAMERRYLNRALSLDISDFNAQERLNYEIFVRQRESAIAGQAYPDHLIPLNQFYNIVNWMVQFGSGAGAQPFETAEDYDEWLARLAKVPAIVDQLIDNMREGVERGVVQPRVLMEKVLPQLEAHLVDVPEESLLFKPIRDIPEDIDGKDSKRLRKAYVEAIQRDFLAPVATLKSFIDEEYLAASRASFGLSSLPSGEDWYAYLVRLRTTTDLSPEEIHKIGLVEVARIHGEMIEVMQQVGFEGSLEDFFEFTATDPRFLFSSREEMLQSYRDFRETVAQRVPRLFSQIPEADFEIRAVEPYREQSASGASYQRASADGSRPGIFYVNTYDAERRTKWGVESLYLHEAAPGHHFQIALQQELESLPAFRRFGGFTAFVEGWALYAESLGKELGVYTDPYQYYGALAAELWRAIRLVVDTGIHHYGWSREKVLEYMAENAPVTESRRVAEAERYMAIPAQALAYKIGQLKIRELRNRSEQALGEDFDVREFHRQVIGFGSMPLDLLEQHIAGWIAAQASAESVTAALD